VSTIPSIGEAAASCDVLVVDDDEDVRGFVQELLAEQGYSSLGAGNGQEALQFLRRAEYAPSLILLDLMMPEMNGWEFLVRLCMEEDRLRRVSIAIMSAHPSVRNPVDVKDTPFAKYFLLPKPFDAARLLAVVSRAVHGAAP
jgi:DNA-binding response OmpR family regulator